MKIGIDIGGTFTDIVVREGDEVYARKVTSDPDGFIERVASTVSSILARHRDVEGLPNADILHATTVATNLLLEGRGARTGLITTANYRDVLEIGRMRLPVQFDFNYQKLEPLVPRRRRRVVPERTLADGAVETPLDPDAVRHQLDELVEQGVEAIAIGFLNSHVNDAHEKHARQLAETAYPHLLITCSSELSGEAGEYERFSTAVVNAYLLPGVQTYLQSLESALASRVVGPISVMQSNGGLMSIEAARTRPSHIVESGPAAGVIAAAALIERSNAEIDLAISFDMGGTTAKAALIEKGEVAITNSLEVGGALAQTGGFMGQGGHALQFPAVDLAEVGAGAGSYVKVDSAGGVHVGPESAGGSPGPVCYGLGGETATVTDANVVLGLLNPTGLLGGALEIDSERAAAALKSQVADPLDLDVLEAAWVAHEVANSTMMPALRAVTTLRGRDPRGSTLVAFGGSGPVHACGVAELLDIPRVIVPPYPGVFSALGLLEAVPQTTVSRSFYAPLDEVHDDEMERRFNALEAEAQAEMNPAQVNGRTALERFLDLRFVGQGSELTIQVPNEVFSSAVKSQLRSSFVETHLKEYRHASDSRPIEIVAMRVVASTRDDDARSVDANKGAGEVLAHTPDQADRRVYFRSTGHVAVPVVGRIDVPMHEWTDGPLIIEEYDSTTIVRPGSQVSRDANNNLVIAWLA